MHPPTGVWLWILVFLIACTPPQLVTDAFGEGPRAIDPLQEGFSMLRAEGAKIIDEQGRPVRLTGVNLGNWFLLETWMLSINQGRTRIPDMYTFEKILEDRFGATERIRLMELYRENFMRERDFEIIRSFGMNAVRLPIHFSLLEDDDAPFQVKEEGWKWIDRAIEMCEKHGLYVILDLHGAAGSQSGDYVTGRGELNELWSKKENLDRTVWIWQQIAERYKGRPSIAAYDLLNEPWGSSKEDLRSLIVRLYEAIHEIDPVHIQFFPGYYDGIDHYGNPKDYGWQSVGFTMHFYPGFFGNGRANRDTHARFLKNDIPQWVEKIEGLESPFLIGEFQVALKRAGGGEMMRRYFDAYGDAGWAATSWSYKVLRSEGGIGDGSWGMVVNEDPLEAVDIRSATLQEIEAFFRYLGEMEYEVDEDLRYWMTTDEELAELPKPPPPDPPIRVAPAHDALPEGWYATDIGRAKRGGQRVHAPTQMDVYGGGSDIWSDSDQFRFIWSKIEGDFNLEARVTALVDAHDYTKAGLIVRDSLDVNAAQALVSVLPEGRVELLHRSKSGDNCEATDGKRGDTVTIRLKLERKGQTITTAYAHEGQDWLPGETILLPGLKEDAYVGLAVLSHDEGQLACGSFDQIRLEGTRIPPSPEDMKMYASIEAVQDPLPDGWSATDVGGASPGGQQVHSPTAMEIFGGGDDIWYDADQFRFIWREVRGDFNLSATVSSLEPVHQYTKAGLMIRDSLDPNSSHAMVITFPTGGLEMSHRPEAGAQMRSRGASVSGAFPDIRFKLTRRGNTVTLLYALGDGEWTVGDTVVVEGWTGEDYAGLAVLSHDGYELAQAGFTNVILETLE